MAARSKSMKPNPIETRYECLLKPGATLDSDDSLSDDEESGQKQKYAAFLKEKERRVGPDGFVDSHKLRSSYKAGDGNKKGKKESQSGATNKPPRTTVVDLAQKKEKDSRDYDKRIKIIEDHMWQHKQEERELKRVEGDIIKKQRSLRKEMRDFENAVTRKRMSEEKKLNQGLEKYTHIQHQHAHTKEDTMKQRTEQNVSNDVAYKDQGRKVQLTMSQLARQYRSKMDELELKKIESTRLSSELETKLRKKEEEQHRLKQELAELAIALNMEAQKGRQTEVDHNKGRTKEKKSRIQEDRENENDLEKKLAKGDNDVKAAELNRRKLSADLALTRAHLSLKKREEGRHLQDTENRLRSNVYEQKSLNEAALHAEMDLKAKKIDQKLATVNTRRTILATRAHKEKKERDEQHEAAYSSKFQQRYAEQQLRDHEDHLKHFQKAVSKGEEQEYSLYTQVKNAEYARQQQEAQVKKLQQKLHETKRNNSVKIKEDMLALAKEEQELEYKLQRQQAQLAKVHAEREEQYMKLQAHRQGVMMDRNLLKAHEKEHQRLLQISSRSVTTA